MKIKEIKYKIQNPGKLVAILQSYLNINSRFQSNLSSDITIIYLLRVPGLLLVENIEYA
jgi:hypothetical protein